MVLSKALWWKFLANGLLAMALILSHAMPLETQLPHQSQDQHQHQHQAAAGMMDGHDCGGDHQQVPQQKSVAHAACQSCPGMAIFLPLPVRLPVRMAVKSFSLPEAQQGQGISLSLDTPPPRVLARV
jgi:hypothetical protein